ncbi:MAG: hypothetical protein IKJ40_02350 [Bacteroidales bacterium]|nr:hypothetical protein [Bacteroidales bacterium]
MRGFQQCEDPSSATHPALRAPLSERGWLRSPLIGIRLHKPTDIRAATATSPLGEGCPKGGVCRTVKPNITNTTAKAFIPSITNITAKAFIPNITAITKSPSSLSTLSKTSSEFSF